MMNKKMLTIESLANGYRNQEFLPSEILELYLNNIDEQSKINGPSYTVTRFWVQLKKVIVSVPERTIGKSFQKTNLKKNGFFADWNFQNDRTETALISVKSEFAFVPYIPTCIVSTHINRILF